MDLSRTNTQHNELLEYNGTGHVPFDVDVCIYRSRPPAYYDGLIFHRCFVCLSPNSLLEKDYDDEIAKTGDELQFGVVWTAIRGCFKLTVHVHMRASVMDVRVYTEGYYWHACAGLLQALVPVLYKYSVLSTVIIQCTVYSTPSSSYCTIYCIRCGITKWPTKTAYFDSITST
jgi:hypothetical protein